MDKKRVTLIGALIISAVGVAGYMIWRKKNKKTKPVEPVKEEKKTLEVDMNSENPEELLTKIYQDLITKSLFQNERDFKERATSIFMRYMKDYSWLEKCPKSMEEIMEQLKTLQLYDQFESALEEKYTRP